MQSTEELLQQLRQEQGKQAAYIADLEQRLVTTKQEVVNKETEAAALMKHFEGVEADLADKDRQLKLLQQQVSWRLRLSDTCATSRVLSDQSEECFSHDAAA